MTHDPTTRVLADRYQLGEVLGQGGMAVVYQASDRRLGRTVAVKLLREQHAADEEFVARFEREARAAAALSHPNIVSVFDVGIHEGVPFMVMEYVPGRDLKTLIREEAPLRANQIINLGVQLCSALDYAHRNGVVHRDVKPHNILVTPQGEVKVADFGIALALGSASLTQSGVVMGTAQYLAPEQALGEGATPASDIYAAGVVLYELATGQAPFQAENPVALARMHVDRQPEPPSQLNPQLPQTLEWVILAAMAKDPSARFKSAQEMARALQDHERLASERTARAPVVAGPVHGSPPISRPRDSRERRRSSARRAAYGPGWPLALGLGVAVVAGLAVVFLVAGALGVGGGGPTGALPSPTAARPPTRTLLPGVAPATAAPTATAQPSPTPAASPTAAPTPPPPTPTAPPTATPPPSPTPAPPPSPTPGVVQLPLVRGMRAGEADNQLRTMGLRVEQREVKSPAPAGIVVEQAPAAGALVRQGSTVTLSVSGGS